MFQVNMKEKPRNQRVMLSTLSSFYDPLCLASPFCVKKDYIGTNKYQKCM